MSKESFKIKSPRTVTAEKVSTMTWAFKHGARLRSWLQSKLKTQLGTAGDSVMMTETAHRDAPSYVAKAGGTGGCRC